MGFAMFQLGQRFLQGRLMPFWPPPHDEMHAAQDFEPFFAAFIKLFVHRAPDEFFKALHVFPDGEVGDKLRVAINLGFGIAGSPEPFIIQTKPGMRLPSPLMKSRLSMKSLTRGSSVGATKRPMFNSAKCIVMFAPFFGHV